jgi:muramidase (phage lysozyme)
MNSRTIAIGSGLLVAATSVAIVGAASAAADSSKSTRPASAHRTALPKVDPAVRAQVQHELEVQYTAYVMQARWYQGVTEQAWRDAYAQQQAAATRAASARRSSSASSGGNVLDCIRHRESRGQYGVVNGSSGAAGAYQFMPGTWNTTARSAGRPDLVGVNPANASPADQDAMAQHLLATQGLGPWGGGCG